MKPNESQLFEISRQLGLETADMTEAAKRIFDQKGRLRHIVCTWGKHGVWYFRREPEFFVKDYPSLPVKKVKSVVGAGDNFLSGLIVGLVESYYYDSEL